MLNSGEVYQGDCLEVMKDIDDGSIDIILCDLPYGTTQNKWDSIIPLDELWNQYKRICRGAVILTASQPFTSRLIVSNIEYFKYCWVWDKVNRPTGHLNSKKQPLKITEDVAIFYNRQPIYNPQFTQGKPYTATSSGRKSSNYGDQENNIKTVNNGNYYPRNLISIKADERGSSGRIHPTQKPVALFEYLIRTYTNEGDLVLDNTAGSCTTAIAAINTNRRWICIEQEEKYVSIGRERIAKHLESRSSQYDTT